jgi:hypothetical protein
MQHRVIEGRIYRVVSIASADTRAAARHISAERPEPLTQEARVRRAVMEIAR